MFGFYVGVHFVPRFCSDFKSQAQAQSAYEGNFKLYQQLDGDKDGKVCDTYKYTIWNF